MNLYNEFDKYPAQWLRKLEGQGHIPKGVVSESSISYIKPSELNGFTQCHFFAGIGGWPLALRLAGWPEDRPIWTGSCPCQPFSTAGKRKGNEDERHLWPAFRWLIAQRRPPVIMGEQVASKDGRLWLAGVRADLEALGYEVWAADLCAAGIGAPHIRQRLFWVAYSNDSGRQSGHGEKGGEGKEVRLWTGSVIGDNGEIGGMGKSIEQGLEGQPGHGEGRDEPGRNEAGEAGSASEASGDSGMADSASEGQGGVIESRGQGEIGKRGHWNDYILIPCRDGKQRRIEPRTLPLVDGIPRGVVQSCDISASYAQNTGEARQMRIKGYGNAIVPELAAEFIRAFMDVN